MTDPDFFRYDYTPEDAWEDREDGTFIVLDVEGQRVTWGEFIKSRKFKTWHKRKATNGDYSCEELAKEWGCHRDTIFRWFRAYPGVIKIKYPATKKKGPYTVLRIPVDVATQWRQEHTNK